MKILPIALLFPFFALNPSFAEEVSVEEYMPEFCVATFLVTGQHAQADTWLGRYELRREAITFLQVNLEILLKEKQLRGEDIIAAADGCIEAATEETENADTQHDPARALVHKNK